jgi:hypothetical protein
MSEAYLKEVTLPSQGKLYGGQVPDGLVSIEPMGTREEKLFSAGAGSGLTIINKVFDTCVVCPIEHNKLILGDRLFLLLQIRSVTYGNQYDYSYRCDECRKKAYGSISLDSLVIKGPRNVENPDKFDVTLPLLKNTVSLRLLTGEDEDRIKRYVAQVSAKSRGQSSDTEYIYALARRIDAIDGEDIGIREAMEFVEKLKGADSLALRDSLIENDIGPDISVTPTCNNCGFENEEFTLPMDVEFFRPRKRSSRSTDHIATAESIDVAPRGNVG